MTSGHRSPRRSPRRSGRRLVRRAVCAVGTLGVVVLGACGSSGEIARSDDPRSGAQSGFEQPTLPNGETVPPPTTVPGPMAPDAAVTAALEAFTAALGTPSIAATEFMVQVPETGGPYAFLTSVDPNDPSKVDERMWRDDRVGEPEPALGPPGGDIAAATFRLDEFDWPAVTAAIGGAPAAVAAQVGTLEGSRGITHVIVTSDRPFSDHVVVRVYVDGGARSTGGYVQYLSDGTLDKVQA